MPPSVNVAIPTYDRAAQVMSCISENLSTVGAVVSDNASTGAARRVVGLPV